MDRLIVRVKVLKKLFLEKKNEYNEVSYTFSYSWILKRKIDYFNCKYKVYCPVLRHTKLSVSKSSTHVLARSLGKKSRVFSSPIFKDSLPVPILLISRLVQWWELWSEVYNQFVLLILRKDFFESVKYNDPIFTLFNDFKIFWIKVVIYLTN